MGFCSVFCASLPAVHAQSSASATDEKLLYTVKPGDTLWNISERFLNNTRLVESLRQLNAIAAPTRLTPGTQLRFQEQWLKRLPQPTPVAVTRVVGDATAKLVDGETLALENGAQLHAGDTLLTAAGATVLLTFADGSTMIVRDNSEVVFDVISIEPKSRMVDTRLRHIHHPKENNYQS